MPRGGHNRKPTALKVLAGTDRKDRATNEPKPQPIAPPCPSWLPAAGKKLWRDLAPKLERIGLLREIDGEAFAAMCYHWAVMLEAAKAIKRDGVLIDDPDHPGADGKPAKRKHPALQIYRDNSAAFRGYVALFGLTPADRGRLNIELPKPGKSRFQQYLESKPGAGRRLSGIDYGD